MLVIRLLRVGKKNQPSFKIVVTDKKNPPRGGRFVEQVGFYNPLTKEKILKKERIQYWLSQGVQPSATIHNLLVKEGILTDKKISVHKKSKKKEEKPAEVAKEAPQAEVKVATPKEAPQEEKVEEKAEEKPQEEPKKEKKEEVPVQEESKQKEKKEKGL